MEWGNFKYIVLIAIVIVIAFILSAILRKILDLFINRNARHWHTDPTNFLFLKNSASFIVFIIASVYILITVPFLKNVNTAVFAGAGIAAAANRRIVIPNSVISDATIIK